MNDDVTDQDIDTAGTEADAEHRARLRELDVEPHDPTATPLGAVPGSAADRSAHAGETGRGDAAGNEGPPRSPLTPERMHRAEDDARARARSRDFSEQPDRATKETQRERDQR